MSKQLLYGSHEISLKDDEDLGALRNRIMRSADTGGADGWLDVEDRNGATYTLRLHGAADVVLISSAAD